MLPSTQLQGALARYCPAPRLWREGLAVGLGLDLFFATTLAVGAAIESPERLEAAGGFTAMAAWPVVLVVLAVAGIAALVRFARAPGRWGSGLVALVATGAGYQTVAHLSDSPPEWQLFGGIAMTGWLFGLGAARLFGYRTDGAPDLARAAERLAGAAMIAMLAAGYVKSGTMKLYFSGFEWVDQTTVRTAIAMHHLPDPEQTRHAIVEFFLHSPWLSGLMSVAALVMQAGAFLYLIGPRMRAVWGTLFIGFHTSVFAATAILFLTPLVLFATFSYPWHRLRAHRLETEDEDPAWRRPVVARWRVATLAGAVVCVVGVTAALPGSAQLLGADASAGYGLDTTSRGLHDLEARFRDAPSLGPWSVHEVVPAARGSLTVWLARDQTLLQISVVDGTHSIPTCAVPAAEAGPYLLCLHEPAARAAELLAVCAAFIREQGAR